MQCSASCGIGRQEREVWCQEENAVIASDRCDTLDVPPKVKICNAGECPTWQTGGWSEVCMLVVYAAKKKDKFFYSYLTAQLNRFSLIISLLKTTA